MSEVGNIKGLFSEFPPITTKEWDEKIIKDLKGADYEKSLVWQTNEGFKVRPYYRGEDLENLGYLNVRPSEFPFVRGTQTEKNSWFIRQDIEVTDLAKANQKAVSLLGKGVTAFGFKLDGKKEYTAADLATLLKGLPLTEVEVNFNAGYAAFSLAKAFAEYTKQQGIENGAAKASVVFDPLMCLLKNGSSCSANPLADALNIVNQTKELKKFKSLTVRADIFENAGASIVQQLGFALAVANEYLAHLTSNGVSADAAAKAIKFQFAVGGNYFFEIAKVRAARLLWAQIVNEYKPECNCSAKANIYAVTSTWNKTVYDPYVNMLRTQTEAMSAVLGGVNSLNVQAFDAAYQQPTDFSERIARNQQILLKEEAHFDKVVDPAAGSYYIETLTNNIAEQAWNLFLQVEDKGGFMAAIKAGYIQTEIKAMAQKRDADLANRREILLGVNQYPNFTEHLDTKYEASLFEKPATKSGEIEILVPYRGAAAFEALRYKTDVYSKTKKRPMAFMLTIGNLTMRKARAQFSCNFFAVAGFDVLDNNGFETVEEGMAAARAAKADIIVICSSDDEYAQFAPEVKKLCKTEIAVVAGFPKAIMDDLKAAGLEHFIHMKSNLLDTLTGFQKLLGI